MCEIVWVCVIVSVCVGVCVGVCVCVCVSSYFDRVLQHGNGEHFAGHGAEEQTEVLMDGGVWTGEGRTTL